MHDIAITLGIGLFTIWTVLPFLYLILLSIKPERIMLDPSRLLFHPTFERYKGLLDWTNLGRPMSNSIVAATLGTAGSVLLGSMAAFAFNFLKFRGKSPLAFMIVLTRMYPPVTTVIPLYLIVKALGLLDTRISLIVLYTAFQIPLVLWIMLTFLSTIPREVVESASLDGASLGTIAMRIVLPLSGPGLASAAILSFILDWNEFLFPLVVTSFNAKTATVVLMSFSESEKALQWGMLSVVGIAMIVPMILFMFVLRTYLVKGLTAGMLKG